MVPLPFRHPLHEFLEIYCPKCWNFINFEMSIARKFWNLMKLAQVSYLQCLNEVTCELSQFLLKLPISNRAQHPFGMWWQHFLWTWNISQSLQGEVVVYAYYFNISKNGFKLWPKPLARAWSWRRGICKLMQSTHIFVILWSFDEGWSVICGFENNTHLLLLELIFIWQVYKSQHVVKRKCLSTYVFFKDKHILAILEMWF
jgi:hypothetical protein